MPQNKQKVAERILITGACGQIGSELFEALQAKHGTENVLATDIREKGTIAGRYQKVDVLDFSALRGIIVEEKIDTVYHLAAMLSATAEKHPIKSWDLNVSSLIQLLEYAKEGLFTKLFWPSSIAVFGPDAPKTQTPQDAIQNPTTLYGIAKSAGEKWCNYYATKFGVDVRSIRYPGLISWKTPPGGGTTDYAVEVFHAAVKNETYTCFLEKDTQLPMMAMSDAIRGTLLLMHAHKEKIKIRTSYNINGLSFSPEELFLRIAERLPNFAYTYAPDFRQAIAESWPQSLRDEAAKAHWGWESSYTIATLCDEMLEELSLIISG